MMLKLSRDSFRIIIATGSMMLIGVVLLLVSPIWPGFGLTRLGLLVIGFACVLSLFAFLAIEVDKREARADEKSCRREMHTRFQKMK